MEYVASRVVLIMVMVRGGSSASFRRSSDDMDDLGRSMHEDEPDRLILDYELLYVEIYAACIRYVRVHGSLFAHVQLYEFVRVDLLMALMARDLRSALDLSRLRVPYVRVSTDCRL